MQTGEASLNNRSADAGSDQVLQLPLTALALDLAGALLLVAGLLDLMGIELFVSPESLPYHGHGWILIVAGVALMIVAAFSIIRRLVRPQRTANQHARIGPTVQR